MRDVFMVIFSSLLLYVVIRFITLIDLSSVSKILKNYIKYKYVLVALIIVAILILNKYLFFIFGPSSFEECVLKNNKPGISTVSFNTSVAMCRKMFPVGTVGDKQKESDYIIPKNLLNNIKVNLEDVINYYGGAKFYIYNFRNEIKNWTVTAINFKFCDSQNLQKNNCLYYTVDVEIKPFSAATRRLEARIPSHFVGGMVDAKGIKLD